VARPDRDRLLGVAALTLASLGLGVWALLVALDGGDARRILMFAGAPLLGAVLLAAFGGRPKR
jgi:hypothetical protein